ncbi:MAG: hypothetical protein K8F60_03000 [Melioribacteraceae bacterium]|nr:hypothetical protein [Melioribacteraceae bacterium]
MLQILIVALFFIVAFTLMGLALHFAKYKQGDSGCCGGGHCDTNGKSSQGHSCYSSKINYIDEKVLKTSK